MNSEEQRAGHNDENHRRKAYRRLVVVQHLGSLAGGGGEKALHHEDAVIHADAEDEGRDDDIDEIELQAEEPHYALHDIPAESHREEGDDGDRDVAERQEKDNEDENH